MSWLLAMSAARLVLVRCIALYVESGWRAKYESELDDAAVRRLQPWWASYRESRVVYLARPSSEATPACVVFFGVVAHSTWPVLRANRRQNHRHHLCQFPSVPCPVELTTPVVKSGKLGTAGMHHPKNARGIMSCKHGIARGQKEDTLSLLAKAFVAVQKSH
ncbi:conserved hypothetical protein [Aspergillus terreus NIH2624]|uniref:Secreted protein n=1 Tax=Aspergillus terreus (strain NIH 2624 / FGSC A1156) TaxID=341663 RepID=Q0D0Y7_ASPTN|nr:uncharacterized protein ATEG_00397 [Aspergillus terreus NIH2624]EAU39043.1 conserved hypothetical protein [Aspergillus terreus NIH2624]